MEREISFADTTQPNSYNEAANDAIDWLRETGGNLIALDNKALFNAFELQGRQRKGESEGHVVERFIKAAGKERIDVEVMRGHTPRPNGPRVAAFYLRDKHLELLERWLNRVKAFVGDVDADELRVYTTKAACPTEWYEYYGPTVVGLPPKEFDFITYESGIVEGFSSSNGLQDTLRRVADENNYEWDSGLDVNCKSRLRNVLTGNKQEIATLTKAELAVSCRRAGLVFSDASWLLQQCDKF